MVHVMKKTEDVPDNRYMVRRRQGWYVRLAVPPRLVKKLGKQHILKSLKTRDVAEARQRRWQAIAEIKRQLQELEGGSAWNPIQAALEYRERYLRADPTPESPYEERSNSNR